VRTACNAKFGLYISLFISKCGNFFIFVESFCRSDDGVTSVHDVLFATGSACCVFESTS
jgi:hypothetical protein